MHIFYFANAAFCRNTWSSFIDPSHLQSVSHACHQWMKRERERERGNYSFSLSLSLPLIDLRKVLNINYFSTFNFIMTSNLIVCLVLMVLKFNMKESKFCLPIMVNTKHIRIGKMIYFLINMILNKNKNNAVCKMEN